MKYRNTSTSPITINFGEPRGVESIPGRTNFESRTAREDATASPDIKRYRSLGMVRLLAVPQEVAAQAPAVPAAPEAVPVAVVPPAPPQSPPAAPEAAPQALGPDAGGITSPSVTDAAAAEGQVVSGSGTKNKKK